MLSGSSKSSQLELDVPIESLIERSLEHAGVVSNRATIISGNVHQASVARKSEESKPAERQSQGGVQAVTASPNPLADMPVESGLTASPNPLVGASAVLRPTASPNPLAEDWAPAGPTASPDVLADDVIVDEDNRAPVAAPPLTAIANVKSLDSLFGSARDVPTAGVASAVTPAVGALAAVAPAAVAPASVAPATLAV